MEHRESNLTAADFEEYTNVRQACLNDYRARPIEHVRGDLVWQQRHANDVISHLENVAAAENDVPLRLELALRQLSGWETQGRPCLEGALFFLDPIINPRVENIPDENLFTAETLARVTPPELSVKAHSIAAYAYYKKYLASPEELEAIVKDAQRFPRQDEQCNIQDPLENVICAARHANLAASMQFITPAVLMAGYAFRDLAERLRIYVSGFPHYRPLWRALEKRDQELLEEACMRMRAGGCVSPSETVCAAMRCNATAGGRRGLRPCTGDCPADLKPWYCSKTCREKDWHKHRNICQPRDAIEPPPSLSLGERTRDKVLWIMSPQDAAEQIEIAPDNDDRDDLENGKVMWEAELPSPYAPDRSVRYVMRRYD
ncbi:hypothetical protein BD414DRAFT_462211 [Trametes punicea]|nr:hypothetical protein BD414DRAFT_462211 [Trametes punicea]